MLILKLSVSTKWLMLNPLWAAGSSLSVFIEVGGFRRLKFIHSCPD
jgi:hypothetical protein